MQIPCSHSKKTEEGRDFWLLEINARIEEEERRNVQFLLTHASEVFLAITVWFNASHGTGKKGKNEMMEENNICRKRETHGGRWRKGETDIRTGKKKRNGRWGERRQKVENGCPHPLEVRQSKRSNTSTHSHFLSLSYTLMLWETQKHNPSSIITSQSPFPFTLFSPAGPCSPQAAIAWFSGEVRSPWRGRGSSNAPVRDLSGHLHLLKPSFTWPTPWGDQPG